MLQSSVHPSWCPLWPACISEIFNINQKFDMFVGGTLVCHNVIFKMNPGFIKKHSSALANSHMLQHLPPSERWSTCAAEPGMKKGEGAGNMNLKNKQILTKSNQMRRKYKH